MWNLKTSLCIHTLLGHSNGIECLLNISNSKIISGAGFGDKTIKVWNIETGQCLDTFLDMDKGGIFSLCLQNGSSDVLITGGGYGSIKFTNMQTGERIKTINGHSSKVVILKILQNDVLLSSSEDKIIKVWNIFSGLCVSMLTFKNEYFFSSFQIASNGTILR